jgi:serine/threonine-protein kinase
MGGEELTTGTMPSRLRQPAGRGAERELQAGDVLGSYRLERLLGEGSMGRVFQARHTRLDRQVALKVLRPAFSQDSGCVRRFFQEAQAVNRINHEHIVEIFDFVEDTQGGHVYCVMELLRGRSLTSLLEQERLTLERIQRIAVQVCAALGAAHQLGVVHRDVKPDNLFVSQRPGHPDYVKVLDFGVAKVLSAEPSQGTLEGLLIGTPRYMAPEQASGLPVDHRADIYAVGTLLYEMLSGRPPFEAHALGRLMMKIISEPPPPLPERLPSGEPLPPALAELVMRCLAKEPQERPQQLAELIPALLACTAPEALEERRPTRRLAALGEAHQPGRRGRLIAAVGALVLMGGELRVPPAPPATGSQGVPVVQELPGNRQEWPRDAVLNPFERDAVLDPFAR